MHNEEKSGNFQNELLKSSIIQENSKACVVQIEQELYDSVFKFVSEANEFQDELSEQLKKLSLLYSREAFECFSTVILTSKHDQLEHLIPVPEPSSRKKASKELQDELKKHPDAYHSTFTKNYWDDFNRRHLEEKFVFGLYETLKSVFVHHYLEVILNMESRDLRTFDRKLYRNVTVKFAKAVYRQLKKIRNNK